jgi:hypothetical protein
VKRITMLGAVAAGLLGLGGCALQAQTDRDAKFTLVTCHSYSFSDQQSGGTPMAAAFDNPLNAKRMRDAIASSLEAHHVPAAADGASADCLVSYAIGSRLAPDPLAPQYGWGYRASPAMGGWGPYGGGGVLWGTAPYAYRQGRVTVDLYDARSHQALWHAYVDTDVTELTGAEADSRIRAAVAAIFEKFPPLETAPRATTG